jgi:hypothetical protein
VWKEIAEIALLNAEEKPKPALDEKIKIMHNIYIIRGKNIWTYYMSSYRRERRTIRKKKRCFCSF